VRVRAHSKIPEGTQTVEVLDSGTGTPTQLKKLGTGGRESDVDEVRQPTKT